MSELYYKDYTWINKLPYGKGKEGNYTGTSYKILSDSYQKKVVIEKYQEGIFDHTIYDSSILSFKNITRKEGKELWYREELNEKEALIRDECGRAVVREVYIYTEPDHLKTKIYSPHGIYLAEQEFTYLKEGEVFMKLYDAEGRLVLEQKLKGSSATPLSLKT